MNAKKEHRNLVHAWFNTWGSITTKEAIKLGIPNLGDAIHDLRRLGVAINIRVEYNKDKKIINKVYYDEKRR